MALRSRVKPLDPAKQPDAKAEEQTKPVEQAKPVEQPPAAQAAAGPEAQRPWDEDNDLAPDDIDDADGLVDATQEFLGKEKEPIDAAPPAVLDEHRQVAVHSNSTGGMLAAQQELADAGFVTDTSFGAFPSFVLLNIGQFQCKDWSATPLEKLSALDVIVIQVKRKLLYRERKDKDARICYSYDEVPYPKNPNALDANGNPVAAFVALLEGEGAQWEVKLYYEALAIVVGGEGEGYQDHVESMVLISMSPTTKTKWSGFVLQNRFMRKAMPHQYITRITRGPVMTAKGQNYYPMAFKLKGPANLDAFAAANGFEVQGDVAD